jgi:4-amino-4-deoxy-L-arabinose transferase-like glycosyltransferase
MEKTAPYARLYAPTVLIGLLAALLVAEAHSGARCSVDEPGWIRSGYLAWRLATDLAPPSRWTAAFDDPKLGPWGHQNPPVGKLIIGMATALAKQPGDPVRYVWRWPAGYHWNLAAGTLPPTELLVGVRSVIAWFGVASLMLVYFIARELGGQAKWAPLLAPALLGAGHAFRGHASLVMTDVPQMAFTLLAVWLLLRWQRRQRLWLLCVSSISAGLACGTKFSAGALVLGSMVFLAIVPAPFWKRALRSLLAGAIPAAVFVAVNPHLWFHPLHNTLAMTRAWSTFLAIQQQDPFNAAHAVTSRWQALHLTLSHVLLAPTYDTGAPGLSGLLPRVLVALLVGVGVAALVVMALRLAGRSIQKRQLALTGGCAMLASIAAWLPGKAPMLIAALFVLGAWHIGRRLHDEGCGQAAGAFSVLFFATFVASVGWLPFDWPRYYLPLLGLTPVLAALGGVELEHTLWGARVEPNRAANCD